MENQDKVLANIGLLSVISIMLSACAPTQSQVPTQQERMNRVLSAWVGKSIAEHSASKGNPAEFIKLNDKEAAFRWIWTGQGPGGVMPIGRMMAVLPSQQLTCVVRFDAQTTKKQPELKDWIITRHYWEGYC